MGRNMFKLGIYALIASAFGSAYLIHHAWWEAALTLYYAWLYAHEWRKGPWREPTATQT